MLSILWQTCDIIELIFIVTNGQILKKNLTTWSHWFSPRISRLAKVNDKTVQRVRPDLDGQLGVEPYRRLQGQAHVRMFTGEKGIRNADI